MIQYNPKDWFRFIFQISKGDTLRLLLPLLFFVGLYSGIIIFIEREYLKLSQDSLVKNVPLMHAVLGAVISLVLVFRTNSAYDRWWEGRKQWGDLTNTSRNLAIKLHNMIPREDKLNRDFFKKIIPAYAFCLRNHLISKNSDWELVSKNISGSIANQINQKKHIPNQVADLMFNRIHELYLSNKFTDTQMWLLNDEIKSFTNICGACERIKNTPIPFSYSVFIKKFIFGYVLTLPFGYSFMLGYLAIPIIVFIFYVMASLEVIAEEIEDPFGMDTNDLPTETMSRNIHNNVYEIFEHEITLNSK